MICFKTWTGSSRVWSFYVGRTGRVWSKAWKKIGQSWKLSEVWALRDSIVFIIIDVRFWHWYLGWLMWFRRIICHFRKTGCAFTSIWANPFHLLKGAWKWKVSLTAVLPTAACASLGIIRYSMSYWCLLFWWFCLALKWLMERSDKQWSWHGVCGRLAQTSGSGQLAVPCGIVH